MNQHSPIIDTAGAPLPPLPLPEGKRIAVIQACWHRDIVENARDAFVQELRPRGIGGGAIDHFEVPGSLEIPLQAKLLAKTGRYAVIVGIGLIVDGGIYRHDFVARTVLDGLMRVQLDTEVPVLSVVLTPHHFHEHGEHREFFARHFRVKGAEAAEACANTLVNRALLEDRMRGN
ncbi:MAG: 6,7-dimethyl-8-ribityllumazine synthase [Alphaproteobacteria bacterium]